MKKVSCIICPNSCLIEIDEKTFDCKGNKCLRGIEYAKQEITDPHRSVTSSVKTTFKHMPLLSCRTNKPVKKDKIFDVMNEINKVIIKDYVKVGDVLVSNIADTGADLIATNNIQMEDK